MSDQERPCRSVVIRKDKKRSYLKKAHLVKKEQQKNRYMLFTRYRLRKNNSSETETEVQWDKKLLTQLSTTEYREYDQWLFVDVIDCPKETSSWWKIWK